jgi:hypothetical protein
MKIERETDHDETTQALTEIIADALNIREKVAEKVLIKAIFQPLENDFAHNDFAKTPTQKGGE